MESEENNFRKDRIVLAPDGKVWKRKRNPENWEKTRAKRMRYASKALPKMPFCNHKTGPFKCNERGMQDVRGMHQNFYATPDRQVQNEFILKFVTVRTPIRRSSRLNLQRKKVSIKCFHNKQRNGILTRIQVCKQTFVDTLCISKDRVQSLFNKFFEEGTTHVDKRGGDTRSNAFTNKREAIRAFMNSIQPV